MIVIIKLRGICISWTEEMNQKETKHKCLLDDSFTEASHIYLLSHQYFLLWSYKYL